MGEREQRRKLTRRNQHREEIRDYQAMEDSDEEDSDDGRTLMTGMTKMSRMSRMSRISSAKTLKRRHLETQSFAASTKFGKSRSTIRIKSDADGNVTDVKDLKSVRFAEAQEDSDADEDMEFDSSGKLVVREMEDEAENQDDGGTVYSFKS